MNCPCPILIISNHSLPFLGYKSAYLSARTVMALRVSLRSVVGVLSGGPILAAKLWPRFAD